MMAMQVDTDGGKCCLWIGANTMVEYTYVEALELVESQISQTNAKLQEVSYFVVVAYMSFSLSVICS
jgi:hypothetical protein